MLELLDLMDKAFEISKLIYQTTVIMYLLKLFLFHVSLAFGL